MNRVEDQKLNQTAALMSFNSVFGLQLNSLEKQLITLTVFTFTSSTLTGKIRNNYSHSMETSIPIYFREVLEKGRVKSCALPQVMLKRPSSIKGTSPSQEEKLLSPFPKTFCAKTLWRFKSKKYLI